MKMKRIQFQPGLSMPEFFERYVSEAQCQPALQAARWSAGFACPHQTSLISGTVFESSKLSLTRWFLALQLLTQSKNNVSAFELKRQLGVSYRTAWLIGHKIMQAMHLAEDGRELDGRIEIDHAYLGGEFSGGKTGRGTDNKVPFVAAVQTTPYGRPLFVCLSQQPPTLQAMTAFAASRICPSATVVSDGLWCFGATTLVGAEHERIVTGGGKASMGLPQFKRVNTLLGNLQTAITGTYHAFDFSKYAHRYPAEFQFRFNHRFNMKTILSHLLIAHVAFAPSCERRLRVAEVHR